MDKILDTSSYGICLFSLEILQNFIKKEKIWSKNILNKFQKDKKLYLGTQKEGTWIPIVQIDSVGYVIKLDGYDKPFNDEWEQKLEYHGFNIEIKDILCISSIGMLYNFDVNDFSEYETSYQTLDGETLYKSFKYDVPSGRYLVSIKGYARKQELVHYASHDNPDYGFLFSLVKVNEFDGFKNPRESEFYEFNIGWLTESKKAVIHWFSEEEGGRKEPPTDEEYCPVIELENGNICKLYIKFDRTNPTQNKMIDNCRVKMLLYSSLDYLLSSNAEYIICEESRKRGKLVIKKVGRMVIK